MPVLEKYGDLLQATEQFIVHQCNCVGKSARGLALALFKKFPHADVYQSLHARSRPSTSAGNPPLVAISRVVAAMTATT